MNTTVRENIDWVGYVDWTVRDFHSYDTENGTTYNAYLIRDEKTALVDTVKEPYGDELLRRVAALTDLSKIDYLVCNHAELDHAGALPRVIAAVPDAEVVCDKRCRVTLGQHFDTSGWKFRVVAAGDSISLGRRTLQFVETPMVHWPESMFTYIPEDRLLFSMDAFGQHYATSGRFDDDLPVETLIEQAKGYFANIIMPYGKQVASCLKNAARLDIEVLATSHGVVWRRYVPEILAAYDDWSHHRPKAKVLVIYDTMWESTDQMARAILQGASKTGVEAKLLHMRRSNFTRLATEMLDAAVIAIGSATLNRTMMPMIGGALTYLKGLRPTGKAAIAFGSYGWAKSGIKDIQADIETLGWETLREPLAAQFRPTPEVLDECREAGQLMAERALALAEAASSGG